FSDLNPSADCNHVSMHFSPLPCPDISHHRHRGISYFTLDVQISANHNSRVAHLAFNFGRTADDYYGFGRVAFFELDVPAHDYDGIPMDTIVVTKATTLRVPGIRFVRGSIRILSG